MVIKYYFNSFNLTWKQIMMKRTNRIKITSMPTGILTCAILSLSSSSLSSCESAICMWADCSEHSEISVNTAQGRRGCRSWTKNWGLCTHTHVLMMFYLRRGWAWHCHWWDCMAVGRGSRSRSGRYLCLSVQTQSFPQYPPPPEQSTAPQAHMKPELQSSCLWTVVISCHVHTDHADNICILIINIHPYH